MPQLPGGTRIERTLIQREGMPFILEERWHHSLSENTERKGSETVTPAKPGDEYDRIDVNSEQIPTEKLYKHWFPVLSREDFDYWYTHDSRVVQRSSTKGAFLAYFKELNKTND